MRSGCSFLPAALACLISAILPSTAIAQETARSAQNSCSAPKIQTDVRPGAGGAPTEVSVGLRLVDLVDIDDVKQLITGDFTVLLTWRDQRLTPLEGCDVPLDDIWDPGILFYNSGRMIPSQPHEASIGANGSVRYVQRYNGSLASYHDLRNFPFDRQVFRISLFPLDFGEDDVRLVVNENFTGRRELLNISDWAIADAKGMITREYLGGYQRNHSMYNFELSADRITTYYVWKVLLPLCLIVAMSWAVFWINPVKFGTQIELSATCFLTLIAFLFATTNMLPALGYFTLLDLFIGGSTILVFLATLETLATTYLIAQDRNELALRIDRLCRFAFPLVFLIFTILVFSI
jgi:hypothetical protein